MAYFEAKLYLNLRSYTDFRTWINWYFWTQFWHRPRSYTHKLRCFICTKFTQHIECQKRTSFVISLKTDAHLFRN